MGYANPPVRAIFWPDPSIRRYFHLNPDPHYLKNLRGSNILHMGVYIFVFFFFYSIYILPEVFCLSSV